MSELSTSAKIALTRGADFWNTVAVPEIDLPQVLLTDGPHGVRKQAGPSDHIGLNDSVPATCFPPAVTLASTWNPALLRRVGEALGDEARALGVGVLLGPGINLKRNPLCGRNFEYFSEDPLLTAELAVEFVRGVQSRGVGTSLKHFAANNQETDRMRRSSEVDERTLRELYLRAFQSVVTRAQPWTVMCSYNAVNGVRAAEHHWLLTEVLRDEWWFEGLVVSDWGAVRDRVASLNAGLDLQMPGDNGVGDEAVQAALDAGDLQMGVLDQAVSRISTVLRRAAATVADAPAGFDEQAHHELARQAATEGIVLLRNDGILPLSSRTNIAVIGEFARTPRYQGAGSSRVNPTRLDNALVALGELCGRDLPFAPGFSTDPAVPAPADAHDAAVQLARDAEVVVLFLGLGEHQESEGYDRTTLDLPAEQLALLDDVLAVNERVVVVLANGSSVVLPFADRVPAIVEGWLGGQAGGPAIADVLLGVANPSGRLAETIPLRYADVPSAPHFPGDAAGVRYGEGLFVGYRGYDAMQRDVAFPFGHGLSYTTFDYADLVAQVVGTEVHLTLRVINTGLRAGREVVQIYASRPDSAVVRAPRELKAFTDVTLEPGASAPVRIILDQAEFAHWSVLDQSWVVEGGDWLIEVGASSRDLRLADTVTLEGSVPVRPLNVDSTVEEILAHPRGADVLASRFGSMLGGVEPDPDLARMMAQIPAYAIAGFIGWPASELQELLDGLNTP